MVLCVCNVLWNFALRKYMWGETYISMLHVMLQHLVILLPPDCEYLCIVMCSVCSVVPNETE